MVGFLIVVHTLVSIFLIGMILMQASQGGGLSGTFGGNAASSVLGGNNAGNVLSKITSWLATLFLSLAVLISVLTGPDESSSTSIIIQEAENNPNIQIENEMINPTEEVLDLGGE